MGRSDEMKLLTRFEASIRVAADGGANQLYELSTFHGKFVSIPISSLLRYPVASNTAF